MRIQHRLAMHEDNPLWPDIKNAGAKIDRNGSYIWVCILDDEDPIWRTFKSDLLEEDGVVTSRAFYSEEERAVASYLVMFAQGHHGFPQPERDLGYIEDTYEMKGHCESCGIGGRQIAPFRIRKEFGARHSQFLQLNWVFDEFFIRNSVAEAFSKAGVNGVKWFAPVIHKSGAPSSETVQLAVEETLKPSLYTEGFQTVTCMPGNEEGTPIWIGADKAEGNPYCGRIKYHPKPSEPLRFDASAFDSAQDIIKSAEWFGSGGNAFRLTLVSQKVYRLVKEAGWRGVEFEPVELLPPGYL